MVDNIIEGRVTMTEVTEVTTGGATTTSMDTEGAITGGEGTMINSRALTEVITDMMKDREVMESNMEAKIDIVIARDMAVEVTMATHSIMSEAKAGFIMQGGNRKMGSNTESRMVDIIPMVINKEGAGTGSLGLWMGVEEYTASRGLILV